MGTVKETQTERNLQMKIVNEIQNYKYRKYIVEVTGEILTGWPARLEPKEFRFSAIHNEYIVVSFMPFYKPLPQSNVFKSQLLDWKRANGFAPGGYLKTL